METKEFVEKCFANFKNIPENFKNKLVEDLDKVQIKWEFNLFPLGNPNVRLSEVAVGIKNGEKHLIKYQYLEYAEHFWVLVSIVERKLDVFHAKTMEECIKHLRERIDEQQYTDVICGDVTPEFVDEYIYLYGEK